MNNNFTNNKINEIRQQANIVDIIGKYINVIQKGKNYVAVCPFHDDTNPSLSISKDKQIFKCFVCNENGNVFSFVQKYKKIPFLNAVKEVADYVGIDFQLTNSSTSVDHTTIKNKTLYDIVKDTMQFYKISLASSAEVNDYCTKRSLTPKILDEFNIGFSPDSNKLIKFLLAKGYKKEDIFKSGVAIEHNGELYDRFANRLMFPITDLNGNVVAFSGRIINKSDAAKYVNSPESEIFIKGNTLYNYALALPYIKKEKKIYICEGFMDCIALHRVGILNCIALMGTAFTKEHLKIFNNLKAEIILTLDGDNPGNINANKLANELLSIGLNVKVVFSYNDVKDLDEFYVKYGDLALVKHLQNNAMDAFDFNFYLANKLKTLENNEDKKAFLRKMCQIIAKMDNEDKDIYINKIHDQLGFSLTTIKAAVDAFKTKEKIPIIKEVKEYQKINKYQDLQIRLLIQMLDSKEAIEIFIDNLVYLEDDAYRKIAFMISEYYKENKDNFDLNCLVADLFTKVSTDFNDDIKLKDALNLIDKNKDKYPQYNKESFKDLIYEITEIIPLEKKLKKISDEIKFADSIEKKTDYINQSIAIKRQLDEKIKKKNGR